MHTLPAMTTDLSDGAKVALTMLHVTNTLAYNLSNLQPLFSLTSLRQLHLVTYGADPDDVDFR